MGSQLGRIALRGLRAIGHHGVFDFERAQGQPFVVDLEIEVEMPTDDDLANTVNYAELAQSVADIVQGEPVNLIETLAQRIADRVLGDRRIRNVCVSVHKPAAPIAVEFSDVVVTISRSNCE